MNILKRKYLYITLFIILLILTLSGINAQAKSTSNSNSLVNIYFFHSDNCSHCKAETKFLTNLEANYSNIKVYYYEVHNQENNQKRLDIMNLYNLKGEVIPLTIIGNTPYFGYNEDISNPKFIKTIHYYSKYGYQDKAGEILEIKELSTPSSITPPQSLEVFLNTYANYHLLGPFYTNDFDLTSNTTILALLHMLTPIIILGIILISILLKKEKQSPIYMSIYLIINALITLLYVLTPQKYNLICVIIASLISIGTYNLLKYKLKSRKIFKITMILATVVSILNNLLNINKIKIFKDLLQLHILTTTSTAYYYINYISTLIIANAIYLIIYLLVYLREQKNI